ncbi:MAG: YggS family pyridoxal phosphate-dependent enzyme [Bacteroidetes bacterium]|nr:YggS family pyridoxal phosphate-dependent enzyme [Bacteroidota bacterium]
MVAEHIQHIETRITDACRRAGRIRDEITLVAVTKTQPVEVINEVLRLGVTDIGENRVQEYLGKRDDLLPHRFHMIGHLQRNKVKYLIGGLKMIHSVDSADLAEEIEKRSAAADLTTDVLIEVNTSGEDSKFGVAPETAQHLAEIIFSFPHVRLRGLMTVAEYVENPEDVRPGFRLLRTLRDELQKRFPDGGIRELSMGMTNDFEIAIEEGATLIRIGSAIFGPRE